MKTESTPGDYYEEKRQQANQLYKELQAARQEIPMDSDKVRELEEAYELACYVGD